ncbi:MAG: hypothetical protein ABW278_09930 [Steroidobacteraceae bacterium]
MSEPAPHREEGQAELPGVFSGHLLGYVDLVTALLGAWQASVRRKLLGGLLAMGGLAVGTMLLTVGSVAAAWDTAYRWHVLLGVSAAYLLLGVLGIWMLTRPSAVPAPMSVLTAELRKDATLLSQALRRPAP